MSDTRSTTLAGGRTVEALVCSSVDTGKTRVRNARRRWRGRSTSPSPRVRRRSRFTRPDWPGQICRERRAAGACTDLPPSTSPHTPNADPPRAPTAGRTPHRRIFRPNVRTVARRSVTFPSGKTGHSSVSHRHAVTESLSPPNLRSSADGEVNVGRAFVETGDGTTSAPTGCTPASRRSALRIADPVQWTAAFRTRTGRNVNNPIAAV